MTEVQTVTETEALVVTSLKEGVLCVTLNRPERLNALTAPMERLYIETMLAAADNPEVRVIVVTGAGRAFCAGADLGMLGDMSAGAVRPTKLRRHLFTTTIAKPIIAAINGPCIGVGFAMAMMCDMRFAALGTKFGPGMAPLSVARSNRWNMAIRRPAAACPAVRPGGCGRWRSARYRATAHDHSRAGNRPADAADNGAPSRACR